MRKKLVLIAVCLIIGGLLALAFALSPAAVQRAIADAPIWQAVVVGAVGGVIAAVVFVLRHRKNH